MYLLIQSILKIVVGILLSATLIFLPAGTFDYTQGWISMGVVFIPILITGVVLFIKNPALLEKRLQSKEQQMEQNVVVKLSGLIFLIGFIIPGCQYRFGGNLIDLRYSYLASVIYLLAYLIYIEVMRENVYLSRTIEIQEGHKVIDTGLYGIIRHPMYSATIIMFLSVPLILGSLYSFLVFLAYPLLIVTRIKFEEQLLREELDGYDTYCEKVRYRLIPYVW